MTVSAHDVADEIRRLKPNVGDTALQKLLYYAQGWHLAFTGEPMFAEAVMAWDMGPVVAELWADQKHGRPRPTPSELDDRARSTIEHVLRKYGSLTARDLVNLTHQEQPWRDAYRLRSRLLRQHVAITHEAMERFFEQDDELVPLREEAARLADRMVLGPVARTAGVEDSVARALRGERRDTRSA